MKREAVSQKVMVLGVDGMDPFLTKKFIDMGLMPNTKKYVEAGAQREDLVLLGGQPTVTPPMWTTLATGAYANVHGITDFYRPNIEEPDKTGYNLDSRLCMAEQLWNVTAEAGKKTLVFHWPGSSWPPTSDSENLYVVDGSSPGSVGTAVAQVERDYVIAASTQVTTVKYAQAGASDMAAPCLITDLETDDSKGEAYGAKSADIGAVADTTMKATFLLDNPAGVALPLDLAQSPISDASGWENAPEGAKEFTMLFSGGLVRRPALILKNENGVYDRIAIYKSKKDAEPAAVVKAGEMYRDYIDVAYKGDTKYDTNRNVKLMYLAEDASALRIYISAAMDINNKKFYHPESLYDILKDNAGYCPPTAAIHLQDQELHDAQYDCWDSVVDWYVKGIHHMIDKEGIEVVFSHMHNVDMCDHTFIRFLKDKGFNKYDETVYQRWLQELYVQTDRYLGEFLHYLDEDWTIIITSDHALISPQHQNVPLGCMMGVNVEIMEELGYSKFIRNERNYPVEVDWANTKAIATQGNNIYINLKGRQKYGIVDPADKYELEEQIMTDLYGYKHPVTGKRVVALALRNKDAVLLGYGGPRCGDICYFIAEGYARDHCDGLSTAQGVYDTSLSPIFIAAGTGLKKGYTTDRVIRQIDVAPTMAALLGVRMPAQCEGAPIYQIFEEEY